MQLKPKYGFQNRNFFQIDKQIPKSLPHSFNFYCVKPAFQRKREGKNEGEETREKKGVGRNERKETRGKKQEGRNEREETKEKKPERRNQKEETREKK